MTNQGNDSEIPLGWELKYGLHEHNGLISRVEWSPDGKILASASFDRTIKLWNLATGQCIHTLEGHNRRVWTIVWSPDSQYIASGSADNTIRVWRTDTGKLIRKHPMHTGVCLCMAWSPDNTIVAAGGTGDDWSIILMDITNRIDQIIEGHSGQVNSLAWSPDGKVLASASHDSTIRLWDKETKQLKKILRGHSGDVYSVAWSPDGQRLASASHDRTIRLWNPQTMQLLFILEGHTASVNCVQFSNDGKFLASKSSDDTVRLWHCDTWQTLTVLEEATSKSLPFGLAFHPIKPILATLGEADTTIRIWKIDAKVLLNESPTNPSDLYRNAKVVLVGESGVGKSGLSLVLTNQKFVPTESTHSRHVWTFDTQELQLGDDHKELREILLWDLAGQPSYRLIHQLHLNELAIALIVFDARSETDPFAGVYYWNRALRQAQKLQGDSAIALKKFLVVARADRGSIGVSKARINALINELGFDGYFETSAKEGWQIPQLAAAIRQTIEWDDLPNVISTELFQKIKDFLIQEKKAQRLLSPSDDLYRAFLLKNVLPDSKEVRDQFDTCIGRVESRDLIRRLSFGNLILLQPELLDAYASAIINAAKDQPEGMGYIVEEDVLAGRFRMPKDERIPDREQEKLLLIATVEELFAREIALRVQAEPGPLLVFPSQFTREWTEAPDPEGKAVIFEFEGAVLNVYTTLAVRLSRSEIFKRKEMWKNAVTFIASVGGECGIWLRHIGNIDEGKAELTLFFKREASEETRLQFEEYVHTHLKRRALPETISRRRIFVCPVCDTSVTELQAMGRRKLGFDWIRCNVCDNFRVSLLDGEELLEAARTNIIPKMDKAADAQREIETATSVIKGKVATNDFDVFLSYNSEDKALVEQIANLLRERSLNPWLDNKEIRAGQRVQNALQEGIEQAKSAAIFLSLHGLGDWQKEELLLLNNRRTKKGITLIPVLLPGLNTIPEQTELLFLRELSWVRFIQSIHEKEPLERLTEAIKSITKTPKLFYQNQAQAILLVHQTKDKELIKEIADKLENEQIQTYLSKDILQPGRQLRELADISTIAICFGEKTADPTEEKEFRYLIAESLRQGHTIIPVILSNFHEGTELPHSLRSLKSVDFRNAESDPLNLLIWAITGVRPKKSNI
ncbi:TIR domain-containing protein [Dendronalium sp. ChiSLP03b]|uniref:TIR domain-containing protein n=1 Tax=Dendronalium sp. ChiSLP03b TaxID=3075381 RepID=UPI002AD3D2CB|nr:TIR domain-containing protein [Dendronalium sp. ChiSLP03b]MDZ8203270.1 TIR domain-containing protein [Dendronalium sp. ChiSLP03b]